MDLKPEQISLIANVVTIVAGVAGLLGSVAGAIVWVAVRLRKRRKKRKKRDDDDWKGSGSPPSGPARVYVIVLVASYASFAVFGLGLGGFPYPSLANVRFLNLTGLVSLVHGTVVSQGLSWLLVGVLSTALAALVMYFVKRLTVVAYTVTALGRLLRSSVAYREQVSMRSEMVVSMRSEMVVSIAASIREVDVLARTLIDEFIIAAGQRTILGVLDDSWDTWSTLWRLSRELVPRETLRLRERRRALLEALLEAARMRQEGEPLDPALSDRVRLLARELMEELIDEWRWRSRLQLPPPQG